jgi:undecaprenyl diphosphate synthase
MKTLVTHLLKNGVKEISIYLSSIQNFRRPPNEIEANLRIVESALEKEIEDVATNHGLVVTISGNREVIPSFLADKFNSIEEKTHDNLGGRLNLLVAYDPVEEVAEAFKKADAPENFIKHLTVKTPLDLIIRSGGVPLTSNFLPLQAAYARLYFLDKLFNEVTTADLDEILRQFGVAYRKFGE